jgi:hypothetical protein
MILYINSLAIPPPISVDPFPFIDTTSKTSYEVVDGNEFSLICMSFGTFSGRVMWFLVNEEGGKL